MINRRYMRSYTSYYKQIGRLGLPILVGQLGTVVVGFADNIMVGHYSTEALAAASFVNNIFNSVMFACMGFTYGLLPLAGALFGGHDREESERRIGALVRNAMLVNVLYALFVVGIMTAVYFNLHRLGQPEELMPLIRPYFLLYLAGVVPISIFNLMAQWSYSVRNTTMPMWIVLSANLLNIFGNYLLIYGKFGMPELGLTGAGISTLVARVIMVTAISGIFFLKASNRRYSIGFTTGKVTLKSMKVVWKTSLPVSMQMLFESGSFSAAAIMAGWISTVALAAYQIVVIVGMLGFCLYYAIGSAVAVLVSNEAGTGDKRAMRRAGWAGYHVMIVLATFSSLIFVCFAPKLTALFTPDSEVLAQTLLLIFPLVLYQLGDATQITFANALRGTSHVMPMLWIAFASYVAVGIPATYLMAFNAGLGIYGIILSFSVSLFMAGGLFLYFFIRATRVRPSDKLSLS